MQPEPQPTPEQIPTPEQYLQAIENYKQLVQHRDNLFAELQDLTATGGSTDSARDDYNEANRLCHESLKIISSMRESLLKLPNAVEYKGNILVLEATQSGTGVKQIKVVASIGPADLDKIKAGTTFLADLSNAPKEFRDFMWGGPYLYREEGGKRWLDITQRYADIPYTDRFHNLGQEDYDEEAHPGNYERYAKKNNRFTELLNNGYPLQILDSDPTISELETYYAVVVIMDRGEPNYLPFPLLESMLGKKIADDKSYIPTGTDTYKKSDVASFLQSVLGDQFRGFTDGKITPPNEIVAGISVPVAIMSALRAGYSDSTFYQYHNQTEVIFTDVNGSKLDVYEEPVYTQINQSESHTDANYDPEKLQNALPQAKWCLVVNDAEAGDMFLHSRSIYRRVGDELELVVKLDHGWEIYGLGEEDYKRYADTVPNELLAQLPEALKVELKRFIASDAAQQKAA